MNNPITQTEDTLLAQIKALLGGTVRKVESVPGGWTLDSLTRALQFAPGVYVAFMGSKRGTAEGYQDGRFTVYCVTKGASEEDRRRGNARVIGAYDLAYLLSQNLDGLLIPGIGTAQALSIDNLFRDAMFELGGTVYGLTINVPNMPFNFEADLSILSDFVLWHADHYNPGGIAAGEAPLATDEVAAP